MDCNVEGSAEEETKDTWSYLVYNIEACPHLDYYCIMAYIVQVDHEGGQTESLGTFSMKWKDRHNIEKL